VTLNEGRTMSVPPPPPQPSHTSGADQRRKCFTPEGRRGRRYIRRISKRIGQEGGAQTRVEQIA
jgi:hypothetical protein